MITTSDNRLSQLIRSVCQEVNSGVWQADRLDGIPAILPDEIQITAEVAYADGIVSVRSMTARSTGASTRTTTESQTTSNEGSTENIQGGENISTQVDTYEPTDDL